MYPEELVKPMRDELINAGFEAYIQAKMLKMHWQKKEQRYSW